MARIAGVDLPRNKKMRVALTKVYGVGFHTAAKVLEAARVDPEKRSDALAEDEIARIRDILQSQYKVEGDLRREINMNIKRLMDLGCYRGLRHRRGLPVRGQRTSTNARTRKGPKRSAGRKK